MTYERVHFKLSPNVVSLCHDWKRIYSLAWQKYQDLQKLKTQPTFYDYEKSLDAIWQNLGKQVLKKTWATYQLTGVKKDNNTPQPDTNS